MKHVLRVITKWALLLHIYLSMAGFVLVLLFSITGLTLNHGDFGLSQPQVTSTEMTMTSDLIEQPDRHKLESYFREKFAVNSPLTSYVEDPDQVELTYTAPGKRTQVLILRADGSTLVESQTTGILGKLGDLHKGHESGRFWYWIIDITAILLTISALTGITTLLSLYKRRTSGFVVGVVSFLALLVAYFVWVPQ